ncbi:hypothetical protein [Achromobacter animicus]|uniref:hypothetical protein n=1 Tax=Achromobacter animicus TaxID=1389935 RepID=UPI00244B3C74|nr:hypothetical protein [Achromobacter animicus]MDH0682944.1 hypothetical protein [Achromobacter animicus]
MKTTSPSSERSGWNPLEAYAGISTPKGTLGKDDIAFLDSKSSMAGVFDRGDLCGSPDAKASSKKYDKNGMLVGEVGATVLVAIVTAAISYWGKRQALALKERQEATKNDTEAQIVMSPAEFQSAKCVVYIRRAVDPKADKVEQAKETKVSLRDLNAELDLVIVMKVVRPTGSEGSNQSADHFFLVPVYVSAPNSIALTKADRGITVAIGLTMHQIGEIQGIPTLASLGVASTAVTAVPLNKEAQCVPGEPGSGKPVEYACRPTGILPLPMAGGTIVLGIGVQERGTLGFDVDVAEAQIEAIAAALGPLSATLLDGHFKRARARAEQ